MGNCWFFKYSPRSKAQPVSEPHTIKIAEQNSENSIINPETLHIDLILENQIPANLFSSSKKKDTEISIDSPLRSPVVNKYLKE